MLGEPSKRQRDSLAGLKLGAVRTSQTVRGMFDGLRLSVAPPNAAPERTPLDRAVERYARAPGDILTARREGGTELPHPRAAFAKAGKALDVIEPNDARDIRHAFNRHNSLIDAAAQGCNLNTIRPNERKCLCQRIHVSTRGDLGRVR